MDPLYWGSNSFSGKYFTRLKPGNTKGGSITVPLTLFEWFELVCFANKNKIVSCHTADSKPVKQEVIGTVILPPLVFHAKTL